MSQENVKLFFNEMEKNEALREKLRNIKQEEGFIAAANEAGFSFDLENLKAFLIEQRNTRSAALSDDEIANVTGGGPAPMEEVPTDGGYTVDGYYISSIYSFCLNWTQSPSYLGVNFNGVCLGCVHFVWEAGRMTGYCLLIKKP